jgi:hypothetical protein
VAVTVLVRDSIFGQEMAKQDDYVRITIRIPAELHADLVKSAGPRSLNAEIVERLSESVFNDERRANMRHFAYSNAPSDFAPGNNPEDKIAALIERIRSDADKVALLSELFGKRKAEPE